MRIALVVVMVLPAAIAQRPEAVRLLEKHCAGCHSGAAAKGSFSVASRDQILKGGSRGPAVVPGDSRASLLFKAISHTSEPHMPLGGAKLPDADIAAIAKWIDDGANIDGALEAKPHWAFQLPKRPGLPPVADKQWSRNPIDAFLASAQEKRGLKHAAEADKRTLIRRAYLDLVGVPPAPAEVKAFLADSSSGAYEKMVDKLLADPRYGERWGRHWMDVWRYSDWYGWRRGNDVRNSHKYLWRWRDWIVESLNTDKGYDRMIQEMLAGDEIAPGDPAVLRATGYLARNYSKYDRHGWMQDAVDHSAAAFLGVTLKCARCHDHKYDPFTQVEYYRFRAFFEPYEVRIDRVPGEVDTGKDGLSRVFDAEPERPTHLLIRGDIQNPDKSRALEPAVPAVIGGLAGKVAPVALPLDSYYPDHRGFVHTDLVAKAGADVDKADAEVKKALEAPADAARLQLAVKTLAAAKAYVPALEARIAADRAHYAEPPDPKFEDLANAARKLEREAGVLKADENLFRARMQLDEALRAKPFSEKKVNEATASLTAAQTALTQTPETYTPVGQLYPEKSSGRRTMLANWIASKQNPLTARVAVNHIWMRHFGRPLVAPVFDFGRNGKAPAHPEMLDWLAVELMESGWKMKALHRLIVTSSAYKMKSAGGAADDPENVFLTRMNPRRMEAEVVRDSVLAVAGQLETTMGGPELDETKGLESKRRSIYFSHSPDTQMEFLKMFDAPSPVECYSRNESVVPQQALALANSDLSRPLSKSLAARLSENAPDFVGTAFETVLGRPPTQEERNSADRFLKEQPGEAGRASLVHVLFNHNDFVTIR